MCRGVCPRAGIPRPLNGYIESRSGITGSLRFAQTGVIARRDGGKIILPALDAEEAVNRIVLICTQHVQQQKCWYADVLSIGGPVFASPDPPDVLFDVSGLEGRYLFSALRMARGLALPTLIF